MASGPDYAWILQTTFVLSILLGAPLIAIASLASELPTWEARSTFAIQAGAMVWVAISIGTLAYDWWARRSGGA
ncbi:DUF5822 domain-containing protein [Halococcoides cellulosivorans]|uniref:Peptidoglycan-binding protein n=1 Tax=Halococcoides cellulosivorans TaxID=1679096 RepID=A0A2R4WYW3_9EURY|nr:DUF5822 domain-containing protein [Halococcoides cellulosivorans]AWB26714.1 hypothetical protein HARCEL1_02785 [Halococcoides cellulosivorans]